MANKAFVVTMSIGAAGDGSKHGVVSGMYVLLDQSDGVLATNNCSFLFGYSDTAKTIRDGLVANIRESNDDVHIQVVFLESK